MPVPRYDRAMPTSDITVATRDGSAMSALVAAPDGDRRWPTAVVLGELFGLYGRSARCAPSAWPHATREYVTIAPDLLHRRAPDGPLPENDEGRQRGLALIGELTRLELVCDVRDALDAARDRPAADPAAPPIALGMSFGGHVAILAAARLGLRT